MLRILQIVDCMDLGGIQTFIMNTYREMIKRDVQFDFMTFHQRKQHFEDEIVSLGGMIYKLPSRRDGLVKTRKAISKFYDQHPEYTVVHYQTSSLSYLDPLVIAEKKHVPIRIVHSHSTNAPGNRIHYYLHNYNKKRIKRIATHYFACGELAAKWMFDGSRCEQQVKIINNGIDIKLYTFNAEIREELREKMGLVNKFVLGHVGRFSAVKNHQYILDVYTQFLKLNPELDTALILVGDGDLRENIENYAKQLGINDKVMFLGARNDVEKILQAMDFMIMPSLYEGFPVTAIEAQASGLSCVLSDSITKEVLINDNIQMLSIKENPVVWAKAINPSNVRMIENGNLIKAGFDMKTTANELYSVYNYRGT